MRNISILQCPSEIGAGTQGASLGPKALQINAAEQNYPLFEKLRTTEVPTNSVYPYHVKLPSIDYLQEFVTLHNSIYKEFSKHLQQFHKHLIFTGDHSNAAGFISTLKDQHPDSHVGVIWIDAHGDLHTPYTTPSGNLHGMPLGAVTGLNNKKEKVRDLPDHTLKSWQKVQSIGDNGICPKINLKDIFFIDIRDLEEQEWNIIKANHINYTSPEFRETHGINRIIEQVRNFSAQFDHVYISFDVDSLDAELVPGTGTPVSNGLSWEEATSLLKAFWVFPNTKALEITEINPLKDHNNQMANRINGIINNLEGLNFGIP